MQADNQADRAKEMYIHYRGNRFFMALNGEEQEYDMYHVSKEMEEAWRKEYLTQFFELKRSGKDALSAYATAVDFLKRDRRNDSGERFLYYPFSNELDDVTALFMLPLSFELGEECVKQGTYSKEGVRKYIQDLDRFGQGIQKRAEAGALTRAEDYTMQEFSDTLYIENYLSDLRQKWTRLI